MNNPIMLQCPKCKRKMKYGRNIDPSIPAEVATIIVQCDKCNAGDFDSEVWLDVNDKMILPPYGEENENN